MTLATEPTTTPIAPLSHLETWSQNDRMRHIPSAAWIVQKLDGDLRRKIDLLWNAAAPQVVAGSELDREFRALCRAIDRVAEVARRNRGNNHPPAELVHRISWGISHAIQNLNSMDADTFGRRYPFHTFERSNAEPLWGAFLTVIEHVRRLTELVRTLDRGIDERLYEGLVTLQTPLDARPIA